MERIKDRIEKLEREYKYSAKRYLFLNRLVTIPSIMITSLSSMCSFFTTTTMVDENTKNNYIIVIAILTSISSMFQTLSSSCEFGVKYTKFVEATQQINHLSDKIFFEIENANEKDFVDKIEIELEKIKNQCKYIPLETKSVVVTKKGYSQLN
jgi:hypothetical protein